MNNIVFNIAQSNLLVDTHCHLHSVEFAGKLDKVLLKSEKQGLDEIWLVSVDETSFLQNIEIIKTHQSQLRSLKLRLGLGFDMELLIPGSDLFAEEFFDKSEEELAKELKSKLERLFAQAKQAGVNVELIGEIGMDFYWLRENKATPEILGKSQTLQRLLFTIQLDFAVANNLPVSIHTRGAEEECIDIVADYVKENSDFTPIFHSFTGTKVQMQKILEIGGYIGINGISTYTSAKELKQALKDLGSSQKERFLLETDAPYLIPAGFDREQLKHDYGKAFNVPYSIISTKQTLDA
jgi:TatD DNase family protein